MGPIGSAYAYAATALVMLPISYVAVSWLLALNPWRLAGTVWRPTIASAAMFAAVDYLGIPELDAGALVLLPDLLLRVFVGIAVYACCLGTLWVASGRPQSAEISILRFMAQRLRRG
jgi:hypothetical protein